MLKFYLTVLSTLSLYIILTQYAREIKRFCTRVCALCHKSYIRVKHCHKCWHLRNRFSDRTNAHYTQLCFNTAGYHVASFHTLASTVVFPIAFPKSSSARWVSGLVSGMRITFAQQFHYRRSVQ